MKNARMLAAGAAAAAALVAVSAGPALADTPAPVSVTKLPANVTIAPGGSVSVQVVGAAVCAAGTTNFAAGVPGRQDAVTLPPLNTPGAYCGTGPSAGNLNVTVSDNPNSTKKNAVVKFSATNADGSKVVQTMVVHISASKTPGVGNGKGNGKN
jgi:hypothetical protein